MRIHLRRTLKSRMSAFVVAHPQLSPFIMYGACVVLTACVTLVAAPQYLGIVIPIAAIVSATTIGIVLGRFHTRRIDAVNARFEGLAPYKSELLSAVLPYTSKKHVAFYNAVRRDYVWLQFHDEPHGHVHVIIGEYDEDGYSGDKGYVTESEFIVSYGNEPAMRIINVVEMDFDSNKIRIIDTLDGPEPASKLGYDLDQRMDDVADRDELERATATIRRLPTDYEKLTEE